MPKIYTVDIQYTSLMANTRANYGSMINNLLKNVDSHKIKPLTYVLLESGGKGWVQDVKWGCTICRRVVGDRSEGIGSVCVGEYICMCEYVL